MNIHQERRGKGTILETLCDEIGDYRQVIVGSNRGPVQYQVEEDGKLKATRGGGGVAVALSALNRYLDFTWVACAMCEADRKAASIIDHNTLTTSVGDQRFSIRFADVAENIYNKYYSVFCNPFLWFFQHNMLDNTEDLHLDGQLWDAWYEGYIPANRAFADTVAAEAAGDDSPFIMLHDYHLYLTPELVRERLENPYIQHFTHIPWPPPGQWGQLPNTIVRAVCRSLCSCDIVGLQTMRDVHNFLRTCDMFLPEVNVDYWNCIIHSKGRETKVNAYPISVDVMQLESLTNSEEVNDYEQRLSLLLGAKTLMRVDRLEPTKNIVRGFQAYDALLECYPDLIGQVNFMAFLVPSRTNIKKYQDYKSEVFQVIDKINNKYGTNGWEPIRVFYENNYAQAIAGMRLYDVLLVNTLADGMNLVAKEGPTVNTRDGVLVLSERAGAHEQLRGDAISVVPEDIEGTIKALYQALTMSAEEKSWRSQKLRKKISDEDITYWFWRQLADLHSVADRPVSPANRESALLVSTT